MFLFSPPTSSSEGNKKNTHHQGKEEEEKWLTYMAVVALKYVLWRHNSLSYWYLSYFSFFFLEKKTRRRRCMYVCVCAVSHCIDKAHEKSRGNVCLGVTEPKQQKSLHRGNGFFSFSSSSSSSFGTYRRRRKNCWTCRYWSLDSHRSRPWTCQSPWWIQTMSSGVPIVWFTARPRVLYTADAV